MRIILLTALVMAVGVAKPARTDISADAKAGYHDGCSSARGHYTRSRYKYAYSSIYHREWLRGKRACVRTGVRKQHRVHHHTRTYGTCNSEAPWIAFRRGYDHGYRSAKGHFYADRKGCAAYRRGWVSGYRACHCPDRQKPDSYAGGYVQGCSSTHELKIRDDLYYRTSRSYYYGWNQGYKDCRSLYR